MFSCKGRTWLKIGCRDFSIIALSRVSAGVEKEFVDYELVDCKNIRKEMTSAVSVQDVTEMYSVGVEK